MTPAAAPVRLPQMAERAHPWFPREWIDHYRRHLGRRITNREIVERSDGFTESTFSELLNGRRESLAVADVQAVAAAMSEVPGIPPIHFSELFMPPEDALALRPFLSRLDLLRDLTEDDQAAVLGYIEGKALEHRRRAG